jgi:hypothetical protein
MKPSIYAVFAVRATSKAGLASADYPPVARASSSNVLLLSSALSAIM